MSVEVLLPSPRVNMLDTGTLNHMEGLTLPKVCGPHRGTRRPSGTNDSDSDSPPSKKSKKGRRRKKRTRHRIVKKEIRTKPVAPFNTTQFLMAEHDQLQDTDIVARPRRHRDSSFSIESDEQIYSSPEDEDEFMAKEFWNAYEDVHAERLDTMTKAQLVQEYLALEEKVDLLERQLRLVRARQRYRSQHMVNDDDDDDDDEEMKPGEVKVDAETAQKISIFQKEISTLEGENKKLREENMALRRTSSVRSSSSSSSCSSSDSSSSCSSDSSSDNDSDVEADRDLKNKSKAPTLLTPLVKSPREEAVVSASDKIVKCQPDSGEHREKVVVGVKEDGLTATGEAAATVKLNGEKIDLDSPVTPLPTIPSPTSSTSVNVSGEEQKNDNLKEEEDCTSEGKCVEDEVSSTTAA